MTARLPLNISPALSGGAPPEENFLGDCVADDALASHIFAGLCPV